MGTIDESQGREPADAAVVRRSRARTVCQRPLAFTEATSRRSRSGRMPAHRRRSEGCAATNPVAGGRLADQAGHHRPRTRVPRARTHAERRRRVDHVSPSERLYERHLDHVSRDQAERAGCHASHLLHVPGHTRPTRSTTCRTGRSRRATTKAPRSRTTRRRRAPRDRSASGSGSAGRHRCRRRLQLLRAWARGRRLSAIRRRQADSGRQRHLVQVHYTPIGKEIVDRPLIGFTVADKAPAKRWMSYGIVGGGPDLRDPAERRRTTRARRSISRSLPTSSSSSSCRTCTCAARA